MKPKTFFIWAVCTVLAVLLFGYFYEKGKDEPKEIVDLRVDSRMVKIPPSKLHISATTVYYNDVVYLGDVEYRGSLTVSGSEFIITQDISSFCSSDKLSYPFKSLNVCCLSKNLSRLINPDAVLYVFIILYLVNTILYLLYLHYKYSLFSAKCNILSEYSVIIFKVVGCST